MTDSTSERRLTLRVPSMDCASCAGHVSTALDDAGFTAYDLAPATGRVVVSYDGDEERRERAVRAVEAAGYEVTGIDSTDADDLRSDVWGSRRAKRTAVAAVFATLGLVTGALGVEVGLPLPLGDLLLLVAIAVGGEVILRAGYRSARTFSLDIDFLMSAAILGATGVSLFTGAELYVEAASLAVLFNVAELLETYSVDRARSSLAELLELAPETAVVRRNGERETVPVETVSRGETVIVEPGAKIPLDGRVTAGESAVNQAPITGESVPVDKEPGDEVYAGTVNEHGYLEVETTATSDENTLSRVIELVEDAQSRQTKREQFVDRFASYYTPLVVAFAVLTAAVPPLFFSGDPVTWFVRGIALLVIACPCAFVISTPVTVVSGVTAAARNGVLVKGGDHLEAMGEVGIVAFDKTGTLTTGDLEVTDVVPLNGNSEADVLACARGLETRSEHPIASAIVDHAEANGTAAEREGHGPEVEGFEALAGKGVRAELGGKTHYAGAPGLFDELGFDLSHVHFTTDAGELPASTAAQCEQAGCLDLVHDLVPRLQREGKTVVLVGTDEEVEGIIAVADGVRPEAKATVARLNEMGLRTVMLTGDNEGTARAVADEVGVTDVRAGLLPEQKVAAVEALEEEGRVAMVGDGINDAPALATATVGIAMGAAGSDTAIETADIALLSDDIAKLPYLVELSRTATGVIRQNIWASLGVKALLAVGIPLGYVSVVLAVLAGDVGMTTLVTGNAMRLAGIDPDAE
ncbi:heavy metal translocating P-type ATPase [Natronomonas sp. EA1]|uniref:heavy metal translocating P-type ATPase n=1 Tax=Natronomonas sp. EA1 TaxID=3421655 RepID=UPI003EBF870C